MRDARLNESQTGIKIAGRNISNLIYADDTTLMAESEELKSLLMKVFKKMGTSLVVQGLRLNAGDVGLTPGWGTTRSHMPQGI